MINQQQAIHSFSLGAFVWWTGVVEDRFDPEELGRVRVRILGYHTEDKSLIPTEDLHWAFTSQSITSAALSGIGRSPTGMVEGTHCWGFFRDGHTAQDPVVCGTWGGVPKSAADATVGFNDPSGKYPKKELVGEPDTHRLARGKVESTQIQAKNDSIKTGVKTADGGSWDEPKSPYAAKYPYNHVTESESGHLFEVDDTAGAERLHRYHKSGTSEEVHPDGTRVVRIVGENFTIITKDDHVHIAGKVNITVDGDANIAVGGNTTMKTDGNFKHEVGGNYDVKAKGSANIESGGPMKFKAPRIDMN